VKSAARTLFPCNGDSHGLILPPSLQVRPKETIPDHSSVPLGVGGGGKGGQVVVEHSFTICRR